MLGLHTFTPLILLSGIALYAEPFTRVHLEPFQSTLKVELCYQGTLSALCRLLLFTCCLELALIC